jgi:predicted nuclease with TOPRIM domain
MIPAFEKIEAIKQKLLVLVQEHERLTIENGKLRDEVKTLSMEVQKQHLLIKENQQLHVEMLSKKEKEQLLMDAVMELEHQLQEMKTTSLVKDEHSIKNIEKQVSHYIREIDRCIALLSQ